VARGRKIDLISELTKLFRQFDKWYNSNLFLHHLSEKIETESTPLEKIIKELYGTPDGLIKYDFSAIDADVLGNVYEQYLGTVQKRDGGKDIRRKKQGIYYTPTFKIYTS
jgi:type I restriction-modification system DNA methylase subunit